MPVSPSGWSKLTHSTHSAFRLLPSTLCLLLDSPFAPDKDGTMASETPPRSAPSILQAARKVPLLSMVFRRLDTRQHEIVALLRRASIFTELNNSELIELLVLLHERAYTPRETIFSEGGSALSLYVVVKGEV